MRTCKFGFVILVGLMAAVAPAAASTIDLTDVNTSGVLDGVPGGNAWFIQGGVQIVSGTGVFPSFVQVKAHGSNTSERAYNTTVNNVMDNGGADPHNHEIQMSDLAMVSKDGVLYYEFLLDINESATDADKYLSLNDLVIKTSTMANQSATSIAALLGTTIWDMAPGDAVLLDYGLVSSGSGRPDMTFLVPVADFGAALATDYVYLYSEFGLTAPVTTLVKKKTVITENYGASAGFEEWAIGKATVKVPDAGTTGVLLGAALAGLGFVRRRFQ